MNDPRAESRRFLVLGTREIRTAERGLVCRVQLLCNEDRFWGEGRDVDSEHGRARAAAHATLRAAEPAAGSDVRLGLEGALVLDLFGRRYVVVSVEAVAERRFANLTGIAAIDRSIEDAACVAVLDAVERWIAGQPP